CHDRPSLQKKTPRLHFGTGARLAIALGRGLDRSQPTNPLTGSVENGRTGTPTRNRGHSAPRGHAPWARNRVGLVRNPHLHGRSLEKPQNDTGATVAGAGRCCQARREASSPW